MGKGVLVIAGLFIGPLAFDATWQDVLTIVVIFVAIGIPLRVVLFMHDLPTVRRRLDKSAPTVFAVDGKAAWMEPDRFPTAIRIPISLEATADGLRLRPKGWLAWIYSPAWEATWLDIEKAELSDQGVSLTLVDGRESANINHLRFGADKELSRLLAEHGRGVVEAAALATQFEERSRMARRRVWLVSALILVVTLTALIATHRAGLI